ncbi:MAG: Flp pilus assembly complex ATPase component TadA, partial [Candidatus Omnitrophica bacterium]|nr:Flp pilus assembly complex ATPase component TadA [Candidatus Omnitrophota bacterium]MBU1524089.1 Flp pilus assembly complex ATPase component TadA [Candidatus Omnitrophota bacterium]
MKEIGSLRNIIIDKSVLEKVPVKFAGYYKFMPLKIEGELLTIAVSQPLDIKISDEIRLHFGFDIETVLSTSEEIMEAIRKNYGLAAETVGGLITQQPMGVEEDREEKIEEIEKEEEASVIKLVNQIFLEAYKKRATDIHIEPYRRKLSLRYRIDGVLYETNVPSQMKQFLNPILSRIKIMANLNIVERR